MSPIRMSERAARIYYLIGGAIIAAIFAAALCAPAPQPTAAATGFVPQQHQAQELPPPAPIATIPLRLYSVLQDVPGAADAVVDLHTRGDGTVIAHVDLDSLVSSQHRACKPAATTTAEGEE